MKRTLESLTSYTWGLLVNTAPTWDKISSENINGRQLRKHYLYPWISICIVSALIFDSIYAENKFIQTGVLHSIILAISLLGGYFLSNKICFWYLRKNQKEQWPLSACEKIITFSFTTVFIIKVVTTIFPALYFLQILNVYVAYLVWEACRAVLNLNEEDRGNIVLTFTTSIIFTPLVISQCIQLMLNYA